MIHPKNKIKSHALRIYTLWESLKGKRIMNTSFFFFFFFSGLPPTAYGGSQARGQIRAVGAGLHHSHSNTRSERRRQPVLQLTAMPDL